MRSIVVAEILSSHAAMEFALAWRTGAIMSLIVLKIIQSVKEDPKSNRPNEDHFSASGARSTSGSAPNSNTATNNSSIAPYHPMSAMTETPSKDKVSKKPYKT